MLDGPTLKHHCYNEWETNLHKQLPTYQSISQYDDHVEDDEDADGDEELHLL